MRKLSSAELPLPPSKGIFMLKFCIDTLETALQNNPKCSTGLVVLQRAFGIPNNDSDADGEILVILYADDPTFGYWYGHIQRHPTKSNGYVSAVVWCNRLINAPTPRLLFARFRYWIMDRLEYEPCSSQWDGDVFAETEALVSATKALAKMIEAFDLELRLPGLSDRSEDHRTDDRLLSVYGMTGAFDENGAWDPPPMPSSLVLVRTRP